MESFCKNNNSTLFYNMPINIQNLFIKYSKIALKKNVGNLSLARKILSFKETPKTKVVNCKCAYIRPKYLDLQDWINDPNNVYIGRAGIVFINKERFPKNSSEFCNPFKISAEQTREEVIQKYRKYITDRLEKEPLLKQQLQKLRGKNLGCWCSPEPCHGDVLVELLNH